MPGHFHIPNELFLFFFFLTSNMRRLYRAFYYGDKWHFVYDVHLHFELSAFYASERVIWHAIPHVSVILRLQPILLLYTLFREKVSSQK